MMNKPYPISAPPQTSEHTAAGAELRDKTSLTILINYIKAQKSPFYSM